MKQATAPAHPGYPDRMRIGTQEATHWPMPIIDRALLGWVAFLPIAMAWVAATATGTAWGVEWGLIGASAVVALARGMVTWRDAPARAIRLPVVTAAATLAILALVIAFMGVEHHPLWDATALVVMGATAAGALVMLLAAVLTTRGSARVPALAVIIAWSAALVMSGILALAGPLTTVLVIGTLAPIVLGPWLVRLARGRRAGTAPRWAGHAARAGAMGIVIGSAAQLLRLVWNHALPGSAIPLGPVVTWWATMPLQALAARRTAIAAMQQTAAAAPVDAAAEQPHGNTPPRTWLRPSGLAMSMAAMVATVAGRVTGDPAVILVGAAWLSWIIAMVWRAESAARTLHVHVVPHDGPAGAPRRATVRIIDDGRWSDATLTIEPTYRTTPSGTLSWEVTAPSVKRGRYRLPLVTITANHRGGLTRTRWRLLPMEAWYIHPRPRPCETACVTEGRDAEDASDLTQHRKEQGWSGIAWKVSARRNAWWRQNPAPQQRWSMDERQDPERNREVRLEHLAGVVCAAPADVGVSITLANGTAMTEPSWSRAAMLRSLATI